jgi:fibro-slime domain-containing protein
MRFRNVVLATTLALAATNAAAVTLTGTIRDFCFTPTGACTTSLSDFEGAISGYAPGMVSSTLGPGGLPTYVAAAPYGATNATNFAKWYADTPGTNTPIATSLTLTETAPGTGIFTYANNAFFPIDGQGFGDQGQPHNYHFTMHLEGQVSFADPGSTAQNFSFTGDDDLWIYIDGKLVMDLGGVHGALTSTITNADLVNLFGLTHGTVYDIDIFFAERHTTASNFAITTSFLLAPPVQIPEPGPLALMAAGLVGGVLLRRRRR